MVGEVRDDVLYLHKTSGELLKKLIVPLLNVLDVVDSSQVPFCTLEVGDEEIAQLLSTIDQPNLLLRDLGLMDLLDQLGRMLVKNPVTSPQRRFPNNLDHHKPGAMDDT